VYNGELYNYKALRLELQRSAVGKTSAPYFFKTNSDTEVVLAAYQRWGTDCLRHFNGMFAFAVCQIETGNVFVARDHMGVKPLYYSYWEEGFVFSSELRAILRSGVRKFTLNREALPEYTMYQTVHAPNTIVKGIKMLLPGHFAEIENGSVKISRYFDMNRVSLQTPDLYYGQVCAQTRNLLRASVESRMVSDVPFGAFLSGGIDSSIVVGLMSEVSPHKVETFNVSFEEGEFSEAKFARVIAKKFNTSHHEINLRPSDFLHDLPEALSAMDHPGGDGPNTYVVSKATRRQGIKMALSGVGGDELFAGYDVFKRMTRLHNSVLGHFPRFVRKVGGTALAVAKPGVSGKKIKELLFLKQINFENAFPLVRSLFTQNELRSFFKNGFDAEAVKKIIKDVPQVKDHLLSTVSLAEMSTYMQNILLRDADQMGMAVALEIREPFLDRNLVEFVLSVSDEHKFPHTPKKLLVDSMGDLLPPEIVNRPKMGFTLPWQFWMKNDLQVFCEQQVSVLETSGLFKEKTIERLWSRFMKGDPGITWARVWPLIVLGYWMEKNDIR
jgi:asparagine synthase (glutamine-hydrolysing)